MAALLAPGGVGRVEGTALLVAYIAAVALVWVRERRPPAIGELAEEESLEEGSTWRGPVRVVAAIGIMALGGWVAVIGAEYLVAALGVAESIVGLSIVHWQQPPAVRVGRIGSPA